MPMSPYSYPSYYSPPHHFSSSYSDPLPYAHQEISLSHHQEHSMSHHSMQPPPSPSIPIDPALSLYPPYYHSYPPQHQQHVPPHLSLPHNYSSPSSQGSDTIGTPPMYPSSANVNGKRPGSAVSNGTSKKARKDDDDEPQSPMADKDEGKAKPTRGSRACTVCRRLKMKCVGAEQGPPCKRCIAGNHECIFEESNRGKRSSKKHELLTRSLRKMERTLDTVLRSIGNPSLASGMISRSPSPSPQATTTSALLANSPSPPPPIPHFIRNRPGSPKLHSLPDNSLNPLGLLAEASLANRRAHASHPSGLVARSTQPGENKLGVASDNYFKPGPISILPLRRLMIERQVQPEMLSFVSTDEVVDLFNIFFEHVNMHSNLLDGDFHTPSLVCSRSPFLLTTICAISSKFYDTNPELHPKLTDMAKKLAFSVPARGYKSLEIVQAYLLLALYGCGAVERYEQDKTWLLLGMAIRMATDLNLHRKTATAVSDDSEEGRARDYEVHNRERTWLLCFCLDRSFSAQMGKPYSIKEDFVIRNAQQWSRAPVAIVTDSALAGYVDLQRMISRSLDLLYSGTDTPSGLLENCDYLLVIKTFEAQIIASRQHWEAIAAAASERSMHHYRNHMSQFYYHYAMLVLNSFGLQNALERAPLDIGHFFTRCHSSAIACAVLVRDHLGPRGFMKYSPDSHFVQTSYAVLSLLKLIRPEFQAFLEHEQQTISLVKDVADVLENIAANPLHTPALYSKFLRALISARLEPSSESKPASRGSATNNRGSPVQQEIPQFSASPTLAAFNSGADKGPAAFTLNEFQFDGEMGPVADMSTFPPTMAPTPSEDVMGALTMDNILSNGFWDSMLVPGYNTMEGLSGGFVFGAGGSGLITPHLGQTPLHSGSNTPARGTQNVLTQMNINAAFRQQDGAKVDA
ncbi:fungal-specific transcription factor domain-containing protein [Mycena vulgaris]|nr:fungal-specific transcription factor domain-containing protein [Mycena vulgaris]